MKNIVTGPTAPCFFTPDLLTMLNEKFGLRSVTTIEEDIEQLLSMHNKEVNDDDANLIMS